MEIIYKLGKYELIGPTLWSAICERSGYNDHPIIQDWYDNQSKEYLSEDWDAEYISRLLWDYEDYEILKIFENNGYHPDSISSSDLTIKKVKKIYNKIKPSETEPNIKELFFEFIKKLEHYCENDRVESAYDRAYEDFSLFLGDINKDNDTEVADFFGQELNIIGAKIEGIEHILSEIFFCESCDEPNLIEDIEKNWIEYQDEEYIDHGEYCCPCCGAVCSFNGLDLKNKNKHLSEEWIMSRLI
jgi:hypothetical protein